MVRRLLLLGVTGLFLGACARAPIPPIATPTAPTTMSTNENDAATQVVVDAEANAYVLGQSGLRSFLTRYRTDGTLDWRTELSFSGCAEGCDLLNLQLVGDKLYLLLSGFGDLETDLESLIATFDVSGKELSNYPVEHTGDQIAEAVTGAKGEVYTLSRTFGEHLPIWYLDAFSLQGQLRWSKTVRFPTAFTNYSESGVSVATALDGSVYLAGIGNLNKYSADGTLQWARQFSFDDQAHLREHLVATGNGVYYLRELTLKDVVPYNVEIKRFDSEGDVLWTQALVNEDTVDTGQELGLRSLVVDPLGELFLVSDETYSRGKNVPYTSFSALYKVTLDAQVLVEERTLGSEAVHDLAFAPFEEDRPAYTDAKATYLFAVGSSHRAEAGCYDPEDESTGSPYCPDTDAFLTKYRLLSSDHNTALEKELVWLRY